MSNITVQTIEQTFSDSEKAIARNNVGADPFLELLLPPVIYGVEGMESNIYFDGLIDSYLRPSNYDIRVKCSRGRLDDNRWRITPSSTGYSPATTSDIGTTAFTVEVSYNGNLLATASSTLSVKAASTGSGVTRKALLIGDSLLSGGEIASHLNDLGVGNPTNYALTMIGTQGGATKHEGYSGKTYDWMRNHADSPFTFSGSFDFAQYLTTNSFTMSSGDHVVFLLGVNDMFGWQNDADAIARVALMQADLAAMISNIQSAVPGVKIWVSLVTSPSQDQSSFGNHYPGTLQTRNRYNRNLGIWRKHLLDTYGGSATVKLMPINCCLDTRNNMVTEVQTVNARNSDTTVVQTNGEHPRALGDYQIGDCIYSCLLSAE